jgi:hypothetical protein
MVAQSAGRADHDLRASSEHTPFTRRIHAADTGGEARTGMGIEPGKLSADLKRQFTGRGDDQRERGVRLMRAIICTEQIGGHGKAEGDGFP